MLRSARVVGRDDAALEGGHAGDAPDREVFEVLPRNHARRADGVPLDDRALVLDDHLLQLSPARSKLSSRVYRC